MELLDKKSLLWDYLTQELRDLVEDGEHLAGCIVSNTHKDSADFEDISDYSFMVFPFAKAYEGFLKKFLLDLNLIKIEDYYSDDIRIGRILNPRFVKESSNVFTRICDKTPEGIEISHKLWEVWKSGRNQVFHYFPHNFRRLDYEEAMRIIKSILGAMEASLTHCHVKKQVARASAKR